MNVSPPLHIVTHWKAMKVVKTGLLTVMLSMPLARPCTSDNTIPQIMLKSLEIPWEPAAGSFRPAVTKGNEKKPWEVIQWGLETGSNSVAISSALWGLVDSDSWFYFRCPPLPKRQSSGGVGGLFLDEVPYIPFTLSHTDLTEQTSCTETSKPDPHPSFLREEGKRRRGGG